MNVLVLTPDAVGSTLLQRVLTVYMQLHSFDMPVINLHELTNGIFRYYSDVFNKEVLGKSRETSGYYQSLSEITDLLSDAEHYITSRLAQYHIINRSDPIQQQIPFYNFLNDNFYIIACRRENVFEHAISWYLNTVTGRLNVYTADQKIWSFLRYYNKRISIDTDVMISYCEKYKNYIQWSEDNFRIARYFVYERDVAEIEKFILDLPVFSTQKKLISWQETFGQSFSDWNKCHYMGSNISAVAIGLEDKKKLISMNLKNSIINYLPSEQQNFYSKNSDQYLQAHKSIERMVELGILTGTIPIKKQTLQDKKMLIKNWDQCVEKYNQWANNNSSVARPINEEVENIQAVKEQLIWNASSWSPVELSID